VRAIDVGCHEGFYTVALVREGVKSVLGVDVREENLLRARFVSAALGLTNVEWRHGNCEDLRVEQTGEFELCLFLGLLYHLENPMLCLRNISRITREVCVIETQVIDEVEGATEWGWREWTRPYHGALALIDESGEFYHDNTEAGSSPIATCPSPKALEFMLKQAGFRRVETIAPPPGAYEQHARGKRVVAVAYK
jgi:ubiquinone/menaquinone biosynthesis C-methylase UbiE